MAAEILEKSAVPSTEARDTADAASAPNRDAAPAAPATKSAPKQGLTRKRKIMLGALGAALIVLLVFGVPWIRTMLSTVSTDDAYVNGHVTFVAPRVHGQVARVLVDDNNRVHKGDLLVELDKEPFRDAVAVKKAAVDTAAAERTGQLEVRPWENAYLRGGQFDQQAMLALIEEVLDDGKRQGFGLTRLWANMEWALEGLPGVHDIVEYETRLNYILPKHDDLVVCTYDLTKFSAAVAMDILRTHPQVIVGGILRENPYYVPPDEFLREVRARDVPAH